MELSKHLYKALKVRNINFGPITRLRYSLFTVLYPTGISCQLYSIVHMRQEIGGFIWGYLNILPQSNIIIEMSYSNMLIIALLFHVPSV